MVQNPRTVALTARFEVAVWADAVEVIPISPADSIPDTIAVLAIRLEKLCMFRKPF